LLALKHITSDLTFYTWRKLMKRILTLSAISTSTSRFLIVACSASLFAWSVTAFAGNEIALVDDFSNDTNNSIGLPRQFMNDTMVGGGTQTKLVMSSGVMQLTGEIVPPRGQPGWASTVLLLDGEGKPVDASKYKGIRMLVKINSGSLSISANSTEVTNFDYHSSVVIAASDGNFHEVNIPFDSLKRTWSEQTNLNTQSINSLSIVAFSMQKASFDYEIDEVSFY
jgi:hypothetical protein